MTVASPLRFSFQNSVSAFQILSRQSNIPLPKFVSKAGQVTEVRVTAAIVPPLFVDVLPAVLRRLIGNEDPESVVQIPGSFVVILIGFMNFLTHSLFSIISIYMVLNVLPLTADGVPVVLGRLCIRTVDEPDEFVTVRSRIMQGPTFDIQPRRLQFLLEQYEDVGDFGVCLSCCFFFFFFR